MKRPVSVVILTWNGIEDTKRCLDSVLACTRDETTEIVVVDNGSTDGTIEYLEAVPRIIVLKNGENLGFVRGNNTALRLIDSDRDVVLLNNDTLIEDPDWLEKLATTAFSAEDVGVVGCRIRRIEGGMLQHAGTYMPDFTYWGQQTGGGEIDINQYNTDREVEGVVFACVYIRREVIDTVGFLDEDFFSYFEDTDYCFKAKKAGYKVMVCGSLTIGHLEHGSTTANKVNLSEMFRVSQKTFLSKWKSYLDSRLTGKVNLYTTFSRPVGYAMTARQIATGLEEQGVGVSYSYLYGAGTVFPVEEDRNQSSGVYQVEIIKRREKYVDAPKLIYGQADAFDSVVGDGYRIGYTMLETTGVPTSWVEQANKLDELWVPSAFNEWSFARSGVNVPIVQMPLGLIDTDHFNPGIEGMPIEGIYTFLSIFEWGERKAPEVLLRAFNRAFDASDPVALICRFSNHDPGVDPQQIIESLELRPNGGRIVYSINEPVPYYQMAQIYRSADCFVLTTRGEGWGMPIMEAMACGLPVITSYWSAQQSFLSDANSYPLQVKLIPAEAKCPYYEGFKWADPDEDHLVELFRHVYLNQEEARRKGEQAARDVAEKWALNKSVARMKDRLNESWVSSDRNHKVAKSRSSGRAGFPRIGVDISRCVGPQSSGIGRFTAELVNGLSQGPDTDLEFILLPGFGSFVHPDYRATTRRPFRYDHGANCTIYRGPLPAFSCEDHAVPGLDLLYCTAHNFVKSSEAKSVMVVYDMTFLTHPEFHTQENIDFCNSNFERAIEANSLFVAISENSAADFAKQYGVPDDRITTIPCGIDTTFFKPASPVKIASIRQKYQLPESFFLFVGSIEPRKNLGTLLRAMKLHKGPEALVIAGAAGWNNSELHKQIRDLGTRVRMLGYVPDSDLPALYSASRAFVYPSVYEGFGLPIVEAMACGTPVITTDGSSMREIASNAALLLKDPGDVQELRDALERISTEQTLREKLKQDGRARADRYTSKRLAAQHVAYFKQLIGV